MNKSPSSQPFNIERMIKPKEKIGSNIHQNFNTSPEIQAWSKKYNTSIDEIEQIFKRSGSSISKTLEELRLKVKEA